jgi:tRNA (adenine57-N1/adenine58-N1)-methyltransferase
MTEKVNKNELIVLIEDSGKRYFVNTGGKTDKIKGIGVFDPGILVGKRIGSNIQIGDKKYFIFQPSLNDKLLGLKRKTQIILPKDIALIILGCSIESGQTVLEAGIGSGSLTIALANTIAPNGKVFSYDNRDDFIKHAIKNLKQSGLNDLVTAKNKDITNGINEKNIDAIILDIPNPWDAIKHAWNALKTGGYLCCYSPLISQVEKSVKEIKKHGFIEIKTIENIQRDMIVSERGTRPSFNMLGHTGYLTFARKII